jgi:hypothetical protein
MGLFAGLCLAMLMYLTVRRCRRRSREREGEKLDDGVAEAAADGALTISQVRPTPPSLRVANYRFVCC